MKKSLLALAAVCAMTSGAAFADQGQSPWLVRVRAVNLDSANGDSTGRKCMAYSMCCDVSSKVVTRMDSTLAPPLIMPMATN